MAGVSRSGSVVVAYLMIKRGMSFADAMKVSTRARSIIMPNKGFAMQLKFLEMKYRHFTEVAKKVHSKKMKFIGGNEWVFADGQILFNREEFIGFQRIVLITSFNTSLLSQRVLANGYTPEQIKTIFASSSDFISNVITMHTYLNNSSDSSDTGFINRENRILFIFTNHKVLENIYTHLQIITAIDKSQKFTMLEPTLRDDFSLSHYEISVLREYYLTNKKLFDILSEDLDDIAYTVSQDITKLPILEKFATYDIPELIYKKNCHLIKY
jgi:hypothetical protein